MFLKKDALSHYQLVDCKEPNLFKDIFPYSEIPRVTFNHLQYPMDLPKDIWITDTTFRDGQQSMPSFTVNQIVKIYDYLHQLDNDEGIIRQTEFFLYSKKDRDAAIACMERGYKFPQITSWIRAKKEDLQLVKEIGIKETGILMSCSDYHIFKKLNMTRKEAMDMYLSIAQEALTHGIIPRCHLEDITRADFDGFVLPLVNKLMDLSKKTGIQVKIRACDTLGLGVSYGGVALPRGMQAIMHRLRKDGHVPSESLEWHGHNDFYSVVPNSVQAWLHGCSSINTTLFGIGERTGNCPLEAMLIEYGQLMGNTGKVNLHLLEEIALFFERELKHKINAKTPFIGKEFNVTKAGIHADGVLKNQEIYNIFDTEKILNKPVVVAVNEYSGSAGIAAWINTYYKLKDNKVSKRDPRIEVIKRWVDKQYSMGRTTVIRNDELHTIIEKVMPEIWQIQEEKVI